MSAHGTAFTLVVVLAAFGCGSHSTAHSQMDGGCMTPPATATTDVPEPSFGPTVVEPGCKVDGCIHEVTSASSYSKALLAPLAAPGESVDNGVDVYFVRYMSDGDEVTGSVYVPQVAPPAGGFPVVVMNQFTSGLAASCSPSKVELGIGVASTTALRGLLTIVPDAPSYGPPPLGVYLNAVAGRAALDAARAVFHMGSALKTTVARKAVIAGLSQGAHATMSAAAQLLSYSPHLEIRGFVAAEPPADFQDIDDGVIRSHHGFTSFIAMRFWTWQRYANLSPTPVFREPYQSMAESWFENECVFDGATGSYSAMLLSQFPDDPSQVLTDSYLAFGQNDSWPAAWAKAYADAQPLPMGLEQPILIFQGGKDTTVPQTATDHYVAELRSACLNVDYRVFPDGDHTSTALSSFTVAQAAGDQPLQWIRDRLAH